MILVPLRVVEIGKNKACKTRTEMCLIGSKCQNNRCTCISGSAKTNTEKCGTSIRFASARARARARVCVCVAVSGVCVCVCVCVCL